MGSLLIDHLEYVERVLLAKSEIAALAGHPVHKGTAREAFIKEFLNEHLSERVGIGQGEIINAKSQTGDRRNQQDIILYRKDYPKIIIGSGVTGFLAESVVATIEVKSVLTKDALKRVIPIAHNVKKLERNLKKGVEITYRPNTSILSFVVAYDCAASIETVASWLTPIHQELNIPFPPLGSSALQRIEVPTAVCQKIEPFITACFLQLERIHSG